MVTEETTRVLEFYAAVDRGDLPGAMSIFAPDIVWVESPFPPSGGGLARGSQQVAEQVLGPFMGMFSKLELVRDRVIAAGMDVVVLGKYRGMNKTTGKPVVSRFTHTWTIKDGLAIRMEQLADTAALFLAAGYDLPNSVVTATQG